MAGLPITKQGVERLRSELEKLKTVDRPSVIQAIAEARAHGDLSENAEYSAARERQGFIEGRIAYLEGRLGSAQVIDPLTIVDNGIVVFGVSVTVIRVDIDTENETVYQIVGEDEGDLKQGRININSPLAKALLGKGTGDIVEFNTPGGQYEYEILKIQFGMPSEKKTKGRKG